MGELIGQQSLITQLSNCITNQSLSNFMLFVGPRGQGKATLARYVADKLGECPIMEYDEVKVDHVRAIIEDAATLNSPRMYLIKNAESMTMAAQNALLKIAEEPPKNAYIILTVKSVDSVLPTIRSRAKIYELQSYSRKELENFTDDKKLLEMCINPGQVERFKEIDYINLFQFAYKIKDNIFEVNVINVFNIVKHIDTKKNGDGYPIDLLLLALYKAFETLESVPRRCEAFKILSRYEKLLSNKSISVVPALDIMFIALREVKNLA